MIANLQLIEKLGIILLVMLVMMSGYKIYGLERAIVIFSVARFHCRIIELMLIGLLGDRKSVV